MCIRAFHKNVGPEDTWGSAASVLFWTKESESGIWDFTGEAGKSQVR